MNATHPAMGVPNHNGTARNPSDAFLCDPGDAVGVLLSASTTDSNDPNDERNRRMRKRKWLWAIFLGLTAGAAGAGALYFAAAEVLNGQPSDLARQFAPVVGVVGALIGALGGWSLGVGARSSSFVGNQGLLVLRQPVLGKLKVTHLRFENASTLTRQMTHNHTNGAYTGTSYFFTWRRDGNKLAAMVSGMTRPKDTHLAKTDDVVHAARAAELQWTDYKYRMVRPLIEQGQPVMFYNGKNSIGLQRGVMHITFKGASLSLARQDLDNVQLQNGVLRIKRVGAQEGWFKKDGVFSFPVGGLTDFHLFLVLLDELLGLRFN